MDESSVNGILLANKPQGITSNKLLQQLKRLFGAKKAGHTGSLDPLATGMLPICFGEATKFCEYLLNADKCYQVTGLLGVQTNTGDSMGEVVSQVTSFQVSESTFRDTVSQFIGLIQQVPSMFSALKHQGQPLYKFARAGIDIPRKARSIYIHGIQVNRFDGQQFQLTVRSSKGTYIRNLVEDIGAKLGVGAHVIQLHRCYTAGFSDESMYTLEDLSAKSTQALQQCLLPMERAVMHLPSEQLTPQQMIAVQQGKCIHFVSEMRGEVRLYDSSHQFAGLGEIKSEQGLKAKRLLHYENRTKNTC